MSEEEKEAKEYIKEFRNEVFEGVGNKSIMAKNIDILLNLIEKQQKKIKDLEDENYFLKEMYRGTTEYKAINKKVEELGWN